MCFIFFLYIDSNQHLSILLFFCCSAYQYKSKNKFGSEIYKISMKLSRAWIYFSLQRSSKKNSPILLKNTHIVKYNLFCKGHVISARITSENPDEGFKPTSGTVQEIIAFRVRGGNEYVVYIDLFFSFTSHALNAFLTMLSWCIYIFAEIWTLIV